MFVLKVHWGAGKGKVFLAKTKHTEGLNEYRAAVLCLS